MTSDRRVLDAVAASRSESQIACLSSSVPAAGVYFVKSLIDRRVRGGLDVSRRVEVRLAGAEVDHVDPARRSFSASTSTLIVGDERDSVRDAILSADACGFILRRGLAETRVSGAARASPVAQPRSTAGGTSPATTRRA